jgi:peptide/nickel transport system permease protein
MLQFLFRRFIQALIVMTVISIISFLVQGRLGDPVQQMVGQSVTLEEREKIRDELGLNDSIYDQYVRFAKKALQGDLGVSYYYKEPALEVILRKLPATLELSFSAILLIIVISIPCGVIAAIRPKSLISKALMFFSTIGLSVPIFIIAIFLVYFFSVEWQIAPSFGRGETEVVFSFWETGFTSWDGIKHLFLPSLTLALSLMPLFVRLIRSEMMEVLQSEYIKFAWAKGLSPVRIYFIHALKNTLLPIITVAGIQAGTLVAYTILTETIFQWPGMGFLFLDAISRVDTPLISAYLMVVGAMFVITNTLVDLIYGLVNPTVRLSSHGL